MLALFLACTAPDTTDKGAPLDSAPDDSAPYESPPIDSAPEDSAAGDSAGCEAVVWYADADGDGWGDPAAPTEPQCVAPLGTVADHADCDDTDATVYPDAPEICDDGQVNTCRDAEGACGRTGDLSLADAEGVWVGEGDGDYAGFSVAGAGDVDADGQPDVLIGAPYAQSSGTNAGAAYLVLGPDAGTHPLADADARLDGATLGDLAGASVAGAGDTDGDGYGDVLVGASQASGARPHTGAAYLCPGPLSGALALSEVCLPWEGGSGGDAVGTSVAGAGDTNGDGAPGVLVGGPVARRTGMIWLFESPTAADGALDDADAVLVGENDNDRAGDAVSSAGDVDGDGLDDLLVGASWEGSGGFYAGAVYVVVSPVPSDLSLADAGAKLIGETDGDFAGCAVSSAGDTDQDGLADVLVGAYRQTEGGPDAGAAYVVLGSEVKTMSLRDASAKLVGPSLGAHAGRSVAGAGDLQGDGHDDLLIGAVLDNTGGDSAGAAYLVSGPVSGSHLLSDATLRMVGPTVNGAAGQAVAGVGDVSGDGLADLLVGAYLHTLGASSAGAVFLVTSLGGY